MKTGKNIKTPKSNGAVAGLSRDVRVPHKASRSYGLRHVQGIFPACAVVLFCALLFTIQTAAAQSPVPLLETQQEGAQKKGAQQEGVQEEGVQQKGVQEEGVQQKGVQEEGVQQKGVEEEGVQQEGAQQEGVQQEGVQQEGIQETYPVPALPAGVDSASIVDRFALYYWRDRIDLDENYLDNARQMTRIKRYLAESPHIDSITVYAYASPEGVYEHNVWLARKRAEAAKRYILEHIPAGSDFDASRIRLCPMEENWEGLEAEIEANYHRSNREQVLAILRAPVRNDTKKWRLQQIDGGVSYKYIIRNHMPKLRLATWVCIWQRPVQEEPLGKTAQFAVAEPEPIPLEHYKGCNPPAAPERYKRTFVALKSNLLYDAATVLNFAVEVPFNEKFSLLYEHHCPWWLSDNNRFCVEMLSFGGEFRWWFKPRTQPATPKRVQRDALVGHFLGLYGMGGKFDFQLNRNLCYQGEFFSAGLTYGYSMPIAKRLNLEFSISAGYARIPYRHYIPTEDWSLLIRDRNKTGVWHYFGPTKVEIALSVPLLFPVKKPVKTGGNR